MTSKDRNLSLPLKVRAYFATLIVLVLASIVYSIATRELKEYLSYTTVLSAIWMMFLIHLSMTVASKAGATLPEPRFQHFFRTLGGAVLLAISTYGIGASFHDLFPLVQAAVSEQGPVVIGLVALSLGIGLFKVRQWSRVLYGLSEVAVGVVVAVYRHEPGSSLLNPDAFLLLLTAGVYLIVRGLDNVQQGLNREPPDPVVAWWNRGTR